MRVVALALWRPRLTIAIGLLTAVGCVAFAVQALSLNSDENDLFSPELELAERRARFYDALPALADPVILVVEPAGAGPGAPGASDSTLDATADALVAELARHPSTFRAVYGWPGAGFRARYGALYLSERELAELLDRIVRAQPMLGGLSREPGLTGLLRTLTRFTGSAGSDPVSPPADVAKTLERVHLALAQALEAWLAGAPGTVDWARLIEPPDTEQARTRRYLFVLPVVDHSRMDPAGPAIAALRAIITRLPAVAAGQVVVRMTGVPVLAHEDGEHVAAQAGLAGAASLVLVLTVLARGLGSWRMLLAVATTLLVGIAWTVGLATVLVGHLNVISIAFGVLAVGLGVDFAIHYVQCFLESRTAADVTGALHDCAQATGPALGLCAVTTGVAFLAFSATAFDAMAELGQIMAAGMLACLLATFTVLPALLNGVRVPVTSRRSFIARAAQRLVEASPGITVAVFAALALAAAALLPQIRFDASPLSVRDPSADSVRVLQSLLAEGEGVTWNMNVLVAPGREAAATADRLRALDSVADVRAASHYLPRSQVRKLERIDAAALAVLPAPVERERPPLDVAAVRGALTALAGTVESRGAAGGRLASAARAAVRRLASLDAEAARASAADLESRLVDDLERQLDAVQALFAATPLRLEDLPAELAALARARDGRERLEVLPAGNLTDREVLARFVADVLAVAPGAYGEAFTIHRLSDLVIEAFALATAVAFCAVVALVHLVHRSARATLLVIAPLVLACLLTLGACVLLGIALNFANVIVLPLLLGIGVDTGIHLVHRALTVPGRRPLLESHTARAVVLSGLTTLASFGSLALSRHLGLAALGQLLCLGLVCVLASNLLFLPALLRVTGGERVATG